MSSSRDLLIEKAMKQMAEMDKNPAYKMLSKQIEEEQRNPGLRIAREKLEQEARNPVLSIGQRISEQQRFDSLYQVSSRSLRELDRYAVNDRLRDWERRLPDWVLDPKRHSFARFDSMLASLMEAERLAERFATTAHIGLRDIGALSDWNRFATLSQEFSSVFRSLPPEMSSAFLVRANEHLELIRDSAEKRDSTSLDQQFDDFIDYVDSWIKSLGPKVLTREALLAILMNILIAAFQVGLSYKWRLDDKRDADQQVQLRNEKLDAILKALLDLKKDQQLAMGKPYVVERTTSAFARPGSRKMVVGYIYAGQQVLAIATTGRWILVEYSDRFSLERRLGWIRKKYAKLANTNASVKMSHAEIKLLLAIELYEVGKLSLGQAAKLAGLPKRSFIDALGQHHVPVLNYSADELREEVGM